MSRVRRTRWGGVVGDGLPADGFFRLEMIDGVWWMIDPDGGRLLSKGVNTVRFDQDRILGTTRVPYADACERKYGGRAGWRAAAGQRLLSWGFNSMGAWSDDAVATTWQVPLGRAPILDLGARFVSSLELRHPHRQAGFPDVFEPGFEVSLRKMTEENCTPHRNDPGVIGWFIDNELRWGPDWRGADELLTLFLNRPAGSAGRSAAVAFLRDRYGSFEAFNTVWNSSAGSWAELRAGQSVVGSPARKSHVAARDADPYRAAFEVDCESFAGLVAERYFAATVAATKAADPNHLVLGCRFATPPRRSVIMAASRNLDVMSFNCYDSDPRQTIDAYVVAGRPCLISEFSFRGNDSGLPNTRGAGPCVATQVDRARGVRLYVTAALEAPEVVGYHWFEHADQPAEGRFDGENSNFGLVTIEDVIYLELTQEMTALNDCAEDIHAGHSAKRT